MSQLRSLLRGDVGHAAIDGECEDDADRDGGWVQAIGGDAAERFARYRGPILALSFDDDRLFAPPRAVDALLRFYANAIVAHEHITAASLGLERVEHFGFFREPASEHGWPIALKWLERL